MKMHKYRLNPTVSIEHLVKNQVPFKANQDSINGIDVYNVEFPNGITIKLEHDGKNSVVTTNGVLVYGENDSVVLAKPFPEME